MVETRTSRLTMSADPHEVLEELEYEEEFLYVETSPPCYIWEGEDGDYVRLDQTRAGTWLPYPRPVTHEHIKILLEDHAYEIRPHTKVPDGRHHISRRS